MNLILLGAPGAGKGTLMKKLMQDYDNYALSISATTRQPRVGEEDGREYFFRTKEEFEKINKELEAVGVKALFFSSITNPSTRFINGLVYSGVGIFGAISAISGNISVGQLSAFLTYANQYTKPFNEISSVITELQSAFASAKRVFEIIEADEEESDDFLSPLDKICLLYTSDAADEL